MSVLQIHDLGYYHRMGRDSNKGDLIVNIPMIGKVKDVYRDFNGTIKSGRITCLCGDIGDGAAGLSYTLAGHVSYGNGEIRLDDELLSQKDLAELGTFVWHDYSGRRKKPVGKHLSEALALGNPYNLNSVKDVLDAFGLPETVLDRRLDQLSHRRWRTSAAIQLVRGKRLFAFPWLNPNFIRSYMNASIGFLLNVLKNFNTWVIVPTSTPKAMADVVDDILVVKGSFHSF